ncbi:MAG: hypothetical protein PHR87_06940 [Sulfurospirillaceae bacterium]|nr:hypothetical protein [Sulfurospirillaceae bacterium]
MKVLNSLLSFKSPIITPHIAVPVSMMQHASGTTPQDVVEISDKAKILASNNFQSDGMFTANSMATSATSSSSSIEKQIEKLEKLIATLQKEIARLRKSTDENSEKLLQSKELQLAALQSQVIALTKLLASTSSVS